MVSVDFQLSVLELVAELLRTAPSFLVIIDQQFPLRDGHKSRAWCGDGLRFLWERPWESVGRGSGDGDGVRLVDVMEDCMGTGAGTSTPARMHSWCLGRKSGTGFQCSSHGWKVI